MQVMVRLQKRNSWYTPFSRSRRAAEIDLAGPHRVLGKEEGVFAEAEVAGEEEEAALAVGDR